MPSDLVINVRQVGSYPQAEVGADDLVLLQQGGLGGPYYTTTPLGFLQPLEDASLGVGSAVPDDADPGQVFANDIVMPQDADLLWNAYWSGAAPAYLETGIAAVFQFDPNQGWNFAVAPVGQPGQAITQWLDLLQLNVAGNVLLLRGTLTVARDPASAFEVATMGWVGANTVGSFNGRRGIVRLWAEDVLCALGLRSVASEEFVCEAINHSILGRPLVFSFNGREGAVVLVTDDVTQAFFQPLSLPKTPTPGPGDRSFRIANTAWVTDLVYGPLWQNIVEYINRDMGTYAPINSPAFTGIPTAPNPNFGNNTAQIATCNFVQNAVSVALAPFAPLASPNFSGIPTAPTANAGTSTAQLATTAFVMNAITAATTGVVSFNTRTGPVVLEAQDLTDAGGALLASPAFSGSPTAPTPPGGDASARIATTAWVMDEISAISAGVISWNGQSGIVIMQASDITAAGGALLASPAFTGNPTVPTASPGTATTQAASTAFVMTAIASNTVYSFNGRTGAVTLTANDISGAGGLANPDVALTGVPTAPTAAVGTNTNQLATTAFVAASITAYGGSFLPLTGGTLTGSLTISGSGNSLTVAGALNVTGQTTLGNVGGNGAVFTANMQVNTLGVTVNASIGAFLQTNGAETTTGFNCGLVTSNGNLLVGWSSNNDAKVVLGNPTVTWQLGASGSNQNFYLWQGGVSGGYAVMQSDTNGNVTWYGGTSSFGGPAGGGNINVSGSCSVGGNIQGNALTTTGTWTNGYGLIVNNGGCWINGIGGDGYGAIFNQATVLLSRTDSNNVVMLLGNPIGTWQVGKWGNAPDGFFIWQGGLSGSGQTRLAIDNGGNCTNTFGTWSAISDPRLKRDVNDYGGGLTEIAQLQPIYYHLNGGARGVPNEAADAPTHIGLDASKVKGVLPELVRSAQLAQGSVYDTVDVGALVFPLINAVKELSARLAKLEGSAAA